MLPILLSSMIIIIIIIIINQIIYHLRDALRNINYLSFTVERDSAVLGY